MRNTKNITILDDTDEIKFKLTAMSAMSQQTWLSRAGALLVKTGILKADIGNNFDLGTMLNALKANGFSFLGNLDTEGVNALMVDLIGRTAKKLTGRGIVEMTPSELENTFTKLTSLIELEKECFMINFDFFQNGGLFNGPASTKVNSEKSVRSR